MRVWRWILLLLVLAVLAAFGWHWIAADPGYVLVRMRGWRIETSVITTLVLLLLAWALLGLIWRLLRWPTGALSRRQHRLARQRLSDGIIALAEGRHGEAERALGRASRHAPLRAPALLATAEAARLRGDATGTLQALDEASQHAPQAARVLRARALRHAGRAGEALSLLQNEADNGRLPPAGWREYAEAALADGQPRRALEALPPLHKSGALAEAEYERLELRSLGMALDACSDLQHLNGLWRSLSRSQRQRAPLIAIYARRAARLGAPLPAMDEIEGALKREWDPGLVSLYGELDDSDIESRLRRAEQWLDERPNDAGLLTTLGRMCVSLKLWGKAHEYLQRALALDPSAAAWEALGHAALGQGDAALAARCLDNALHLARGETVTALGDQTGRLSTRAIAVEERSEHGLPRLPQPPA